MSGHGSFISIHNNMPINNGNIGNVENIQPQGNVNPQPLNVNGEEPQEVAQENVNPRELTKQLDVLLLQAGKLSTKGVDAKALKEQVRDLGLSKKELKTLNTLIDNAANTINALDKFNGAATYAQDLKNNPRGGGDVVVCQIDLVIGLGHGSPGGKGPPGGAGRPGGAFGKTVRTHLLRGDFSRSEGCPRIGGDDVRPPSVRTWDAGDAVRRSGLQDAAQRSEYATSGGACST